MLKSDFEVYLHKLTSNEKKFISESDYKLFFEEELNPSETEYAFQHIQLKLHEKEKKWRKIVKALIVLKVIFEYGNAHFF